jgi:hypothetical protein
MKSALNKRTLLLAFVLSLPMASVASARRLGVPNGESPFIVPPMVRLTGTLVPVKEQQNGGLDTLKVWIKDQEWAFKLTDVKTLSGTDYGAMLLNKLFPREVRFMGPEDVLRSIEEEAAAGKSLVVEGRLYIADRNFFVTAQGEPTTKAG